MSAFDNLKLAMIPTAWKDGKLYSAIPENGDGDFNFTRGSLGTRIYSSGLLQTITDNDAPRLDYTGGGCPSVLVEPQRENIVTYSEDFTQWSQNNVTLVSGYSAPDGTNTAYKVSGDSTSSVTLSLGLLGTETRTIWAKTVSGTGQLNLTSHNANTNNLFTITENWQRFEVNGTTSTSGRAFFYAVDFRGSSTLTEVIIWGAQAEVGDYATSYIPTSGTTVTRSGDVCLGAGDSTIFNDSEGVFYAELAAFDDNAGIISISDGAGTINRNTIQFSFVSGQIRAHIFNADGTLPVNISKSGEDVLSFNKLAIKYSGSVCSFFINGIKIADDTDPISLSSLSVINFSRSSTTSGRYKGKCKSILYYDLALTDQQCIDLTT